MWSVLLLLAMRRRSTSERHCSLAASDASDAAAGVRFSEPSGEMAQTVAGELCGVWHNDDGRYMCVCGVDTRDTVYPPFKLFAVRVCGLVLCDGNVRSIPFTPSRSSIRLSVEPMYAVEARACLVFVFVERFPPCCCVVGMMPSSLRIVYMCVTIDACSLLCLKAVT